MPKKTNYQKLLTKYPTTTIISTIIEALDDESLKVGIYRHKNLYTIFAQSVDKLGPRVIREYSVDQVSKMLLSAQVLEKELKAIINHFRIGLGL